MNNGAVSMQIPTFLISCWLIDPNGNVYRRDAGENIIILPRVIAAFKEGQPKGSWNIWDHREIGFYRLLCGFDSGGFCLFRALIKG